MGPGEGVALSATVVARVTASASSIHKHVPLPPDEKSGPSGAFRPAPLPDHCLRDDYGILRLIGW